MMRPQDDEETLFDQETLLNSGRVKFSGQSDWCRKFTKTVVLSVSFFALGLCIAIPGPTLLDLGERVGVNTEKISYIFPARSVGYLVGSIIGGFLFDHFDQQILLFYTLFLTAVATTVAPWCTSLTVLAIMISFQGLSMGVLDTGGNVFCIKIWGRKSRPYMQVVHFAFGIGAFVAPLIARPFLVNHSNITTNVSLSAAGPPILAKLPEFSHLTFPEDADPYSRRLRDVAEYFENSYFRALRGVEEGGDMSNSTLQNMTMVSNAENSSVVLKASTALPPVKTAEAPHISKPKLVVSSDKDGAFADGDELLHHVNDHKSDEKTPENEKETIETTMQTILSSSVGLSGNVSAKVTGTDESRNQTSESVTGSDMASDIPRVTPPKVVATTTTTTTTMTTTTTTTPTTTTPTTTTPTTTTPTTTTPTTTSVTTTTTMTTTNATTSAPLSPTHPVQPDSNQPISTAAPVNVSNTPTVAMTTTTPKKPQTIGDFVNSAIDTITHMSKIQFAYMIIGVMLILNSIMFLTLYCQDRNRPSVFCRGDDNDGTYGKESRRHRIFMLFLLFVFFFVYVGMEVTFGGLLLTFSVEHLAWSKSKSAVLTSIFWGSLATGRGFAIFIARCFKPPCMLVIDLVLIVIGAAILSFGISHMENLLWAGSLVLGLGMSSIFPTGVSWADQYFPLTGKSTAVLIAGSALGEMLVPVVTGFLYENFDRMYLMYVMLGLSVVLVAIYIVMQFFASRKLKLSPSSRNGFVPLREDENVPMDSLDQNFEDSGLLETSRHRKYPKPANMEVEYSRLIDVDS